jgi:hypothetical protein
MNKLFIGIPACLIALLLVSFTTKPEVTKTGENLYKVHKGKDLSAADQKEVKAMVAKYYDIKDFKGTEHLDWLGEKGASARGSYIFSKTIASDWINEVVICVQKGSASVMRDAGTLSKILDKYTAADGTK